MKKHSFIFTCGLVLVAAVLALCLLPSRSAAGAHPEPMINATSWCSTPVARTSALAASSALALVWVATSIDMVGERSRGTRDRPPADACRRRCEGPMSMPTGWLTTAGR